MHRAFETEIHMSYQHCAFSTTICRYLQRTGQQSVQRQSSDFTYELRDEYKAEANIVVAVVRVVVVTISGTTVLLVVVPTDTTQHKVRTQD